MNDYLTKIEYADRLGVFQQYLSKTHPVLEVGPSHNPIAPKRQGYQTDIIDTEDEVALIRKYNELGVDTSGIERVDYIWQGESLTKLVHKQYRNIIASHVIEHIPDPVSFLIDCSNILDDAGCLHLAVPDATKCFDFLRPFSSSGQILAAYENKATRHNPAAVYDFYSFYSELDGLPSWFNESGKNGSITMPNSAAMAYEQFRLATKSCSYMDVHGWVFTPYSFLLILHDLYHLGLLKLNIERVYLTNGHEFHVVLGKSSALQFHLEVPRNFLASENIRYLKTVL